jgi:adenylate cyclase
MLSGWALVKSGCVDNGLSQIRSGLAAYRNSETALSLTFYYALLADACDAATLTEEACDAIDEALAVADRTGEHYYDAELYRQRASLLLKGNGNPRSSGWTEAEAAFDQALQLSRLQGVRSFELRTATDLAEMWSRQGRRYEAAEMLSHTYAWFTEGFDTPDLARARAMLDQLRA